MVFSSSIWASSIINHKTRVMKKLKLLSAAIALVFYGVAIANVTAADHPPQNLSDTTENQVWPSGA